MVSLARELARERHRDLEREARAERLGAAAKRGSPGGRRHAAALARLAARIKGR